MNEKYIIKNYHSFISLPTEDDKKPVFLEAGVLNTESPFKKSFTFEQIQYVNIMCDVFKTGRLEFEKKDQVELFEELDILGDSYIGAIEMLDIVNVPTKAKLDKVISLKTLNEIDLFRGIVVSMRNMDNEEISNRVLKVVNKRRDELYRNPTEATTIKIKKTNSEIKIEQMEDKKELDIQEAIAKATAPFEEEIKKLKAQVKNANNKKASPKKTTAKEPTESVETVE